MYAVPRFVLTVVMMLAPVSKMMHIEERKKSSQVLFIGISTLCTAPYTPNISRKWFSVTFFVSFSTTIFAFFGGGPPPRAAAALRSPLRLLE